MTITKCEDVFELLTDERMAVLEDLNVGDLKEAIGYFGFLASMLGEMEMIRGLIPMVSDRNDQEFLQDLFEKGKKGAILALDGFEKLISPDKGPE